MRNFITRTFTLTKATVMVVNIETAEVETRVVEVPNTFKEEKKLVKAIEALLPAEIKLVQLQFTDVSEKIIGMSEETFLKYGVELTSDRKLANKNESEVE